MFLTYQKSISYRTINFLLTSTELPYLRVWNRRTVLRPRLGTEPRTLTDQSEGHDENKTISVDKSDRSQIKLGDPRKNESRQK